MCGAGWARSRRFAKEAAAAAARRCRPTTDKRDNGLLVIAYSKLARGIA